CALKTWRKEVGSPFSFHVPAEWLKQELVPQFLPQRWAGSDIPRFTRGYRNPNTGNLPTIRPFMRPTRRLRGRSLFCQNDACAAASDEPPPQRKWAGNTTFRFLWSLTSRSALRLYTASRSKPKNSTRSSGGSILAVAKSSLSCSMSVLSFSV